MRDADKLSEHADATIQLLRGEGISPTPAEVVRINALAWNIESPGARMSLSRGVPVFIGSVALWPMTLQASDWYERIGCRFDTYRDSRLALAYAMAHSYSDGPELDLTGEPALKSVRKWGRTLRARAKTIDEAIAQVLQQDDEDEPPDQPEDEDGGRIGMGDIVAMLSALTGLPAAEYERRVSSSHALRVFHWTMMQQQRAEGGKGSDAEHIKAERAMGFYLIELREKHKSEKEQTDEEDTGGNDDSGGGGGCGGNDILGAAAAETGLEPQEDAGAEHA